MSVKAATEMAGETKVHLKKYLIKDKILKSTSVKVKKATFAE